MLLQPGREPVPLQRPPAAGGFHHTLRQFLEAGKPGEKVGRIVVPGRDHLRVDVAGREVWSQEPGSPAREGVFDHLPMGQDRPPRLLLDLVEPGRAHRIPLRAVEFVF